MSTVRLRRFAKPATTRSRLVLEVASELVGDNSWPYPQVEVRLRPQGSGEWRLCFFASDTPDAFDQVARGLVDVAIVNPAAPLTMAVRGTGPYRDPLPFRVITVIPSYDQLAFAVHERTGITSLADIRARRYPLRVSMRGQPDHSDHLMVGVVLREYGYSLDDVVAWGGQIRQDPGLPDEGRLQAVERGEVDAIFDEAVGVWVNRAIDIGMRILPIEEPVLQRLERMGVRRSVMRKAEYPGLPQDLEAVDFSGWPVFTRADAPDEVVMAFCAALEARKDRIPWQGEGPLPLDRMCKDTPEGPLDVPLHPAAERFWRERGYLP